MFVACDLIIISVHNRIAHTTFDGRVLSDHHNLVNDGGGEKMTTTPPPPTDLKSPPVIMSPPTRPASFTCEFKEKRSLEPSTGN